MRRLGLDVFETREERVHRRERRRNQHPDILALRPECFGEGEAAAKRVAVGVLVAEDQDLLVGLDQVPDVVIQVRLVPLRGGYGLGSSPSPCGSTSFKSSEMCTLYSIDESSSNRSSGENLRFCSRRPSSWRIRPLADISPSSEAFCSSASPSTLTLTRAWRRSGDIRTAVMLTKPMRGSLRSRRMIDMISSRTCSPTWSAR